MVNEEQTPGKILDEYLDMFSRNIDELWGQINFLTNECKELRQMNETLRRQMQVSKKNTSTELHHPHTIVPTPMDTQAPSSSPLEKELTQHQDVSGSNVDVSQAEESIFYACPTLQGETIKLIEIGDDISNALFVVKCNGDKGIVSYNYDNKLSLLNNVEVELSRYVSCSMETTGAKKKKKMSSPGTAIYVNGGWVIQDKVKIIIS